MELTRYIEMKREIESDRRGWSELNTVTHALNRLVTEVEVAREELDNKEALGKELADVFWFTIAALNAYLKDTGEEPIRVEEIIINKMYEFTSKYDPAHFSPLEVVGKEYTVFDGIEKSRHISKNGMQDGNDVY